MREKQEEHFGCLAGCFVLNSSLTLKAPITTAADDIHKDLYFFIVFQRKLDLIFHVNPLPSRGFTRNIKSYFLQKIKVKKYSVVITVLQILFGALRVKTVLQSTLSCLPDKGRKKRRS